MNRKQLKPAQRLAVGYYQAKINILHSISPALGAKAAFKLFTTPAAKSRKKEPSVMKQAHPLGHVFNGQKLSGYRWQPRTEIKGRLLILHGYGSRIANFDAIIGMGRRLGYEVYGFDAPAHGRSQGSQLNVLEYAHLINELRKNYGPFDGFVAHSLGGLAVMLALEMEFPAHRPKVALLCPATESSTAAQLFLDFMDLPEPVRQSFHREIKNRSGLPIDWFSISRVIDAVPASILWIHEKTDDTTPFADVLPIMQRQLPHVEYLITEGYRHNGIYRQHEVKQRLETFLQQ